MRIKGEYLSDVCTAWYQFDTQQVNVPLPFHSSSVAVLNSVERGTDTWVSWYMVKSWFQCNFQSTYFFLLPHLSFEPWKFRAGRTRVRCLSRVNFPCRGGTSKALPSCRSRCSGWRCWSLGGPLGADSWLFACLPPVFFWFSWPCFLRIYCWLL